MNASDMVREIRDKHGFGGSRVLSAMQKIPRERLVSSKYKSIAYTDRPVPIGHGQTMSQPYTVAFMTHLLGLKGSERVLEVGTGSGYQAAVLSLLADSVYTIERIGKLAKKAKKTLRNLGYENVRVKTGSGVVGWPNIAPFDAIIVTAGVSGKIPEALIEQLKDGGVLVAPIGKGDDLEMTKLTKKHGKIHKKKYGTFHFVPFVTK